MSQTVVQVVASLWSQMGGLGMLHTPSKRSAFSIKRVAPDQITVATGKSGTTLVGVPKRAFESALGYLHTHCHHVGNPCEIESSNPVDKAGPLCLASRQLSSGKFGSRNITYVLPILQALGVVKINPKETTSVWLVNQCDLTAPIQKPIDKFSGDRQPALLTPKQEEFASYLASLWVGKTDSFMHRYETSKHHSWNLWKERDRGKDWWCLTLRQAAEHYSWPQRPVPHDFPSIASHLRKALVTNNDAAAAIACLEIFRWGGVARTEDDGSRRWIKAQLAKKTLCGSIKTAVELLRPGCAQALKAFDGLNLLMNSAMTKVYAAADSDNIIIYDGRVGAALGLLTHRWLAGKGESSVPSDLAFRWGPKADDPAATRNPSLDDFRFLSLYTASTSTLNRVECWADLVRTTSRILRRVVATLAEQGEIVTLLDLERALFMIGYNVIGGGK